jgi:hypothetical protein
VIKLGKHCDVRPSEGMKRCSKCHEVKPATNSFFDVARQTIDGLFYYCKQCSSIVRKNAYVAKREKRIKHQKEYNSHHLADIHRYRVQPGAPDTLTDEEWQEALVYFGGLDAYTGEEMKTLSIDHIIPLGKGGGNERCNILPCNKGTNSRKFRSEMEEWYRKQSFFSEERLNKIKDWMSRGNLDAKQTDSKAGEICSGII